MVKQMNVNSNDALLLNGGSQKMKFYCSNNENETKQWLILVYHFARLLKNYIY